jgi:hypothetical protein
MNFAPIILWYATPLTIELIVVLAIATAVRP